MIDESAAPDRMSATSSPTSRETATSEQNSAPVQDGMSSYTRDNDDLFNRVQTCARELVQLLHRMPVSSRKKQAAIRLLVKVIRVVTPNGHRPVAAGSAADALKTVHGNGTLSEQSSNSDAGSKTRRENSTDGASDSHSDATEPVGNRPDFSRRRVVGL
jgi:hypothetical protein